MLFKDFLRNVHGVCRQSWLLGATCLALAAAPALAQQSWGFFSGPDVAARAVVLMNADTGEVLYAREPHLRLPPASTTKVLTAMVVMENLNPNARLQASFRAASTVPSRIGLREGEMASTHDLLYGLMLKSGNDAAETLAEGAGGSVYGFSSLMNAKAWQLGARNSHFTNPHGLPDDDHYSTAYDLAIIFRQAMKYPLFADIVRTRSAMLRIQSGQAPFGDSRFVPVMNHNRLLTTYEGALGGKTGFTQKARRCFVGEVSRGNVRLIVSILNSPSSKTLWQDAHALLDYGFSRYGLVPQPAQPPYEPQPIMARGTPAMTPDAERLAALSSRTGFTSRFAQNNLAPVEVRTSSATPSTATRIAASYAPAPSPTPKRASTAPSASEDDEPLVWSRPASTADSQAADSQKSASGTRRKSEAVAATKPAAEPLVWSRRATAADSDEFETASPKQSETVASAKPAGEPAAKPTDEPLVWTRRAPAAAERNLAPETPRQPEAVASAKTADEPLVWTRRATTADVEKLESAASAKAAAAIEDDRADETLVSDETGRASATTAMIVDRPAVRWVDDEQEPNPARAKKKASAKSAKPVSAPKAVASSKPATGSAKTPSPVKLAGAVAPSKSTAPAKSKENSDGARSAVKPIPTLVGAKAKVNASGVAMKGQDDSKQAKASQANKPSAVAVKPDKGANAKVIARAEPAAVKLPPKNIKRRI